MLEELGRKSFYLRRLVIEKDDIELG